MAAAEQGPTMTEYEQWDAVLDRLATCDAWPWSSHSLATAVRQDVRYRKKLGLPPLGEAILDTGIDLGCILCAPRGVARDV